MVRRRIVIAVSTILTIAALSSCGGAGRVERSANAENATRVLKVTDGDTIHVLYHGGDERVRLIGIDTPEVPWYGGRGECFGVEAGLYLRRRLQGRFVRLVFDQELRDRYGRLLAYVYLGRELLNLTLVRLGFATSDPVPPDLRMAGIFAAAEASARAQRRGLWGRCAA